MSYRALDQHFRRIGHLQHLAAILQWDEAVMMPPGSGDERAEATATLQVVLHELLTDERLADQVEAARASADALNADEAANLREIGRLVQRASALPNDLVERASRAQLRCEQAWRSLRAENDFQAFAPLLAEVVAIKRESAAALSAKLGIPAYDALLDEFEPGLSVSALERVFAELKRFLPALTEQVIEHQKSQEVLPLEGPFPIAAQRVLVEGLMRAIGFDTARGRLDVSHHPFCGGAPSDVRITTRYDEGNFTQSLLGVLHESGHAKYEQGLPARLSGQPAGVARGMAMHEGQSLLSEMQVSRGRAFLRFLAPRLAVAFPEAVAKQPAAFAPDNLYRLFTRVKRSKIRVDADEVTYPSHIIVRYDIERALIAGEIEVRDIPEVWDGSMRALLSISTAGDDRNGCMQDVHWPSGAFGYFPTYTLGALTAAQLFAAAKSALPTLEADIEAGRFEALNAFLHERIWSRGSLLSGDALLQNATGESLDVRHFEAHLRARYLG
jgi:carboxypeptidase Taq